MTSRWPVRRPTEHAALRAECRSARPIPPVPPIMAALLDPVDRRDLEGVCLASHRVVRAAAPKEMGE